MRVVAVAMMLLSTLAVAQDLPKPVPPATATAEPGPQQAGASEYDRLASECKRLIRTSDLENAQHVCVWQTKAAEKLPPAKVSERIRANENAGESFFKAGKASAALPYYEKAFGLAKAAMGPGTAEYAYAAYYLARVQNRMEHFADADRMYSAAERALEAVRDPVDPDDDDSRYLKTTLTEHAEMLRRTGQEQQAAELDKKAAGIEVQSPAKVK